jgi:6-phosphogluconolactonase
LDPTSVFLYVCNQHADNVTALRVGRETGRLAFTDQYVPIGNSSAIAFADVASD